MLIKSIPEDSIQNYDGFSCVTGVTEITAPSLITHDRRSHLPALFKHAVEEALTESNRKLSVSALSHIQDFTHANNFVPINWKDLTHDHTTQYFWCPFVTYMGKYAKK